MAERVEPFVITVPAATLSIAPLDFATAFTDAIVARVDITIPPGPSGLVGFQIVHIGQSVIPATGNTFIIADDQYMSWQIEGFPTATGWAVRAYNEDVYDHSLHVQYHLNEIPSGTYTPVNLVRID